MWDRHGESIAEGRSRLPLLMPRPAWHEQHATDWWSALCTALRAAVGGISPQRLAALCITHQRETFVPVDEHGEPLRTAILWMDERSRPLLPALDRLYGHDRIHRLCGKPVSGNLSLGKILWLREHEPAVFAQTRRILDVHAYLVYRLTGQYRTSWGSADPTGLFDMEHQRWADDLLQSIGLHPEHMPEAFPPGSLVGRVTEQASAVCGLPAGLPVIAGLGDGQAAGLGAGIIEPGLAYLNLGTAVVAGTFAHAYTTSRAFRTLNGGIPGTFLLETVILGGTYTVTWFMNRFAPPEATDEQAMEALARDVPPGADGLMLVPYWNSAMNPYWDAAASGVVVGWRGVHGRAHLYRALLEGIAFEQRLHTEGVEEALGSALQGYVAIGGGARSPLWCQIIADVTGKPVRRSRASEAAALGAGILAAAASGIHPDVRAAVQAMTHSEPTVAEPDPQRHDLYTRLYQQVYRHLFPALQPYLARLTELTHT